ncbi:type VII toxin-antitoxin system HepT family RNase toxin [Marinomonas algarum]|uniref:DUF86 domain-containing protein n=1 Tax=Marinomonas algarum TaxID=2883105 RepID=A0A9X1LCG7_9GAMM|nr:DUF86 domain-containing protein [Marinomonas algarum]MCB5161472.1 DUF86 domain-containing protein [Marinomonas algarum]
MTESSNNQGLQHYLTEISKHKQKYRQELDALRSDLISDHFRSRDYLAVERLLQVFTELCIGLAKHCLKKIQGHSAAEAYQTYSQLREHGFITGNELQEWKKIIGLRNGLVHDYLKIDLTIIDTIIKESHYLQLDTFSDKAIVFLMKD